MTPHEIYRRFLLPRLSVDTVYTGLRWTSRTGPQWRARCPLHGGKHSSFTVDPRTLAWCCHSKCGKGGGPLEYLNGGEPLSKERFRALVYEIAGGHIDTPPVRQEPAPTRRLGSHKAHWAWTDATELWHSVPRNDPSRMWLASRKLDAHPDSLTSLCRVLVHPREAEYPDEMRFSDGSPWWDSMYRVIFPMRDPRGELLGLRCRKVVPTCGAKSLSLKGVSSKGLAFWRRAGHHQWVIVEGEMDWITACLVYPSRTVLGLTSGTWSRDWACEVPAGAHVELWQHDDEVGERLMDAVNAWLAGRYVTRNVGDLNDLLMNGKITIGGGT